MGNIFDVKYCIGDRVVATCDIGHHIRRGLTGTVCDDSGYGDVGIRWDEEIECGHDCWGRCKYGYGWYVGPNQITRMPYVDDEIEDVEPVDIVGFIMS